MVAISEKSFLLILLYDSHLPDQTSQIKTKLCYTCQKYYNIKSLYKYQKVI